MIYHLFRMCGGDIPVMAPRPKVCGMCREIVRQAFENEIIGFIVLIEIENITNPDCLT